MKKIVALMILLASITASLHAQTIIVKPVCRPRVVVAPVVVRPVRVVTVAPAPVYIAPVVIRPACAVIRPYRRVVVIR
ncbi:hypothetical protein SAMN05421788_104298 [Filimonas lacunae]|uniref:Uncharacterized protein n=1 Tax=Filimonas lacunae TaxID=477680 RepID=A0A1N7Q2A4_9BACT|nr:hypothetical protein [Filimonas lacunae]SIT16976.1 hypothetical protein SAMN05421788_104298 [Filimonas lacunae]